MSTKEYVRKYARFSVKWPATYWNEGLFGQGTILNVSRIGCQVAGTMPVAIGMVLKLWIRPPHREDALCVEEARVLWAKDYEFGVELRRMPSNDHRWVISFLERAERRNSFERILRAPTQEDVAAMPLALRVKE